ATDVAGGGHRTSEPDSFSGSVASAGERHVDDAALGDLGRHLVGGVEVPQAIPEPLTVPEDDRRDRDVYAVDQPGSEEAPRDADTAADADVRLAGEVMSARERLRRCGGQELEPRAVRELEGR